MARFSYTEGQLTTPLAQWALKSNIKSVYTIVLDYATGIDAAGGFSSVFTGGGGKVLGEVRVRSTRKITRRTSSGSRTRTRKPSLRS